MQRLPLLLMLDRYGQLFPRELPVVRQIRSFVECHANCVDRSLRPGHITAGAWIVSGNRQRVLLTHHRKLGRWLQLGGHADGHWAVEQVALKEAREESGMQRFDIVTLDGELLPFDVDVHHIPLRYDAYGNLLEDAHEHYDIRFLMVAHDRQPLRVSTESFHVDWFTPEEVLNVTHEASILRMLRKSCEMLC